MRLAPKTLGSFGGRSRSVAIVLVAAMALSVSAPALAQESSESPAAEAAATGIDFPVMLQGQLLAAETFTGAEWVAQFDDGQAESTAYIEETEALTESVGKSLDDLTVKTALYQPAIGDQAVVAAIRIDGVDAVEYAEDAIHLLLGDVVMPKLVLRPLGNKWALRVVSATMPGTYPRTAYLKDDVIWIIEGDEDYVWDALDQLPDPDPARVSAADSLFTDVPIELDGRRRVGLYELTEPFFLPTLGERLGESIEPWLLDLYLEAGMSPAEMIGVYTWWGLPTPQDGMQIEGYRLPPGAEDMIERLRTEVFLAQPSQSSEAPDELDQLLAGVDFSEQEIAGHAVTTLDFGTMKQHIFSAGDAVWVVTDAVGEPGVVEEAIAALP